MKAGISLRELAIEIERQNDIKQDYLVDTKNMRMETFEGVAYLHLYDHGSEAIEPLEINQWHKTLRCGGKDEAIYCNLSADIKGR